MVNINKLKLTNLQREILTLLFKKTGKILNQRETAKNIGVSPTAIMKSLPFLQKNDLVTITKNKESKRISIELNYNNPKVSNLKKINNLNSIYESGLVEFLEDNLAGSTIILFGSYFRGDDRINSDIDIAIIGRKEKILNLKKFEKILEKEINLQFYNSLKETHKNLKENLLNGIVLIGGITL